MEKITGVILRATNAPKMQIDKKEMHAISLALVDNLAEIHAIDIESTELISLGKPEGYVARQVAGWIKRYYAAETESITSMDLMAEWLTKNLPQEQKPTLLHNDYKFDNLILDPNHLSHIISVLDWEMATVGDPLMDVGASLAYWFEEGEEEIFKAYNLSWLPGNLTRKEFVDRYTEKHIATCLIFYSIMLLVYLKMQ